MESLFQNPNIINLNPILQELFFEPPKRIMLAFLWMLLRFCQVVG